MVLRFFLIIGLSGVRDFLFRVCGSCPDHLCLSISSFNYLNTSL
jgi:hypothetical protein